MGSDWGVDIIVFRSETVGSCKAYALALLAGCWTSASVRKEAIAGHKMIKVTVGGQDVVLDPSRTLAQSGILAGSTLKLKSMGLLGGGGGQTKLFRASSTTVSDDSLPPDLRTEPQVAQVIPHERTEAAEMSVLREHADAQGSPEMSEHLDSAARALGRTEGLALRLQELQAQLAPFARAPDTVSARAQGGDEMRALRERVHALEQQLALAAQGDDEMRALRERVHALEQQLALAAAAAAATTASASVGFRQVRELSLSF
jgi:hypothetical protein